MRWNAKLQPKIGDLKIDRIFPIIPKEIDGMVYWLEWVNMLSRYDEFKYSEGWNMIRIANKSECEKLSHIKYKRRD